MFSREGNLSEEVERKRAEQQLVKSVADALEATRFMHVCMLRSRPAEAEITPIVLLLPPMNLESRIERMIEDALFAKESVAGKPWDIAAFTTFAPIDQRGAHSWLVTSRVGDRSPAGAIADALEFERILWEVAYGMKWMDYYSVVSHLSFADEDGFDDILIALRQKKGHTWSRVSVEEIAPGRFRYSALRKV